MRLLVKYFPLSFCRFCGKFIKKYIYRYAPDPIGSKRVICKECREIISYAVEDSPAIDELWKKKQSKYICPLGEENDSNT